MGLGDMALHVWCAASSPLMQGTLGGFLLATVISLAIFPLGLPIRRPAQGPQSSFARARALKRWSRITSLALMPAYAVTVIFYLVLYAIVDGAGCNANLTRRAQYLAVAWAGWVLFNVILMIVAAVFKRRIAVLDKER